MSNASDARRAALSHAYRVIEDHLYPLMVQAGRLAETDIARRRRHRKLYFTRAQTALLKTVENARSAMNVKRRDEWWASLAGRSQSRS